jgi:hypothetical protein
MVNRKSPHDCRLDQTVCCSLSTGLATRRLPTRTTRCSGWAAAVIAEPWRARNAAQFGDEDGPLHANELRNPTTEQLDALSKFFREQQFARLAVTMSNSAVLPTGKTPSEIITKFDDEPAHGFADHSPPVWTWPITIDEVPFANGAALSLPRQRPRCCSSGRDMKSRCARLAPLVPCRYGAGEEKMTN